MGMSDSAHKRHQMELERRERAAREAAKRSRLARAADAHTMAHWNAILAAGWRTVFYPSVGTALRARCHWLHVVCPACRQIGEADLRKVDIDPDASIGTVVRAMSCKRCSPHPPFARPLGATKRSWSTSDGWLRPRNPSRIFLPEDATHEPEGWGARQMRER